ncbi:hypothetical protein PCANC_02102 [Puccinia coronata f. sp. avenae]|uniref:SigF-like NTF2-like domain-containing protein n=2 Tax=Puccinia coronata f. sp. avenae TaxID=200324 RepID=A0A2N5VZW2_9BASI|nr:hypothetical protein PCASD_05016 [Puccinia coronata f. sp. avenae]PLW55526.1 hypothetical protein PCANC_02102 [Puccinia coronata f. sp. avenae]
MENPRTEIEDVVRSITEPQDAETVLANVDKYFTEDAYLLHPLVNQPEFARGRENLKAIYFMFRKGTFENKIHFHAVMFSEDSTQCTLELTEDVRSGLHPSIAGPLQSVRFLVRVDFRREADGKYRICRQQDNFISDIRISGFSLFPGSAFISDLIKTSGALFYPREHVILLHDPKADCSSRPS